jgi:hypothetical protein
MVFLNTELRRQSGPLAQGSLLFRVESRVDLLALLDIVVEVRTRFTLCLIQHHIMKTFRQSATSALDVNGRYIYSDTSANEDKSFRNHIR